MKLQIALKNIKCGTVILLRLFTKKLWLSATVTRKNHEFDFFRLTKTSFIVFFGVECHYNSMSITLSNHFMAFTIFSPVKICDYTSKTNSNNYVSVPNKSGSTKTNLKEKCYLVFMDFDNINLIISKFLYQLLTTTTKKLCDYTSRRRITTILLF